MTSTVSGRGQYPLITISYQSTHNASQPFNTCCTIGDQQLFLQFLPLWIIWLEKFVVLLNPRPTPVMERERTSIAPWLTCSDTERHQLGSQTSRVRFREYPEFHRTSALASKPRRVDVLRQHVQRSRNVGYPYSGLVSSTTRPCSLLGEAAREIMAYRTKITVIKCLFKVLINARLQNSVKLFLPDNED